MYIIILGAGRIGSSLAAVALENGHDVAIIEADKDEAKQANETYDALVLNADIAEGDILQEARVEQADVLVATTADDSANLMAMFLGVEHKVPRLVSVVNDRVHEKLFRRLGVTTLEDPNVILAHYLYGQLREPLATDVLRLNGGAEMFLLVLGEGSALVGYSPFDDEVRKLLSDSIHILTIQREDELFFPSEETILTAGDQIRLISLKAVSEKQFKIFTG